LREFKNQQVADLMRQLCRLLLLFVSQVFIDSKYVRREVKFADTFNEPVLRIKLKDASLTRGMKMLLMQNEIIAASTDDFSSELERAIRYVRLLGNPKTS
jgi:hypothetical protein